MVPSVRPPCEACNVRTRCLKLVPDEDQVGRLESLGCECRCVAAGEVLVEPGQPFEAVYVIRSGFFRVGHGFGHDAPESQECGCGDLLGVEGYSDGVYETRALAVRPSEVWVLTPALIEALRKMDPGFERFLHCARNHALTDDDPALAMGRRAQLAEYLLRRFGRLQAATHWLVTQGDVYSTSR